jgi:excinuclease ABC subunit A
MVFTGVSGSGKTSLAFDTLYAEGQRRYIESLSAYALSAHARQFLGQMDKPVYDKLSGLSPTIAIEQKTASTNPHSTVGTITEIYDHLRVLYARVGVQHCPRCYRMVEASSLQEVVAELAHITQPVLLVATLVKNRKGEHRELLRDLQQRGFVRVRHNGEVKRLEEDLRPAKRRKHTLELVVDRLTFATAGAAQLTDSVETALREGKGEMAAIPLEGQLDPVCLSQDRACSACGIGLPELSPQSFSFNSPAGMCPACNGLGRRTEMDPNLVVPNESLNIRAGAVVPWAKVMERGEGWGYTIFRTMEKELGLDLDAPWCRLSKKHRDLVLYGTGGETFRVDYEFRRGSGTAEMEWEGALNALMRRFTETKSAHMRAYYQRFFSDASCSECRGQRLRPESRAVRVGGRGIVDVSRLSVAEAVGYFDTLDWAAIAAPSPGSYSRRSGRGSAFCGRWPWASTTSSSGKPLPPSPAAKRSASAGSWRARRPIGRSTSSTSRPPACTSTTSKSCWPCSTSWWRRATP